LAQIKAAAFSRSLVSGGMLMTFRISENGYAMNS